MRNVLGSLPDFKNQKSKVEIFINSKGRLAYFLPRFHCELNPIERVWGQKSWPMGPTFDCCSIHRHLDLHDGMNVQVHNQELEKCRASALICLKDKEQTWKPSSEDKIELARMALGLKEVVFRSDGDGKHIHHVLLETFPECGG